MITEKQLVEIAKEKGMIAIIFQIDTLDTPSTMYCSKENFASTIDSLLDSGEVRIISTTNYGLVD